MSVPDLSVVVVAHDVAPYLQACLDSLAAQTVTTGGTADVEVVVVVGDPDDATGRIAAAAASGRTGWQVVPCDPDRAPGGARNVGIERSRGRRLTFLDGDDLLPRRAYERLLAQAARTGSDLVVGNVRRWDGTTLSTPQLHRLALAEPLERGHLTRDTRLVYDSCVWNKVILRSTWDAAGLAFPERVVYEDLPVAFGMHAAARSTDVLAEPTYVWRRRTGPDLSITQRLDEHAGLEQRFAALHAIDARAVATGVPAVRDAHDAKVVDIDLRRMVTFLPRADAAYRARFLDLADGFLGHVPRGVLAARAPLPRLVVEAVRSGDVATLLDLAVARDVEGRPSGAARLGLLRPDLRVQAALRRRGLLTGVPWLRSTANRVVYHLLPGRVGAQAADRRYTRTRVGVDDVLAL